MHNTWRVSSGRMERKRRERERETERQRDKLFPSVWREEIVILAVTASVPLSFSTGLSESKEDRDAQKGDAGRNAANDRAKEKERAESENEGPAC
jgi:hypothetical protein